MLFHLARPPRSGARRPGAVAVSTLGTALPASAASPIGGAQFMQVRHDQPHFERRGNYAYFNGHRGDRHYHRGWREYNGYWFPPAAFIGLAITGAILNGIFSEEPRHHRYHDY